MTWTRNKTNPQLRHCENCGTKFSTTISGKTRCNKCENPKRFCVKCGRELSSWVDINQKWCSDECKTKLGKEFIVKKVKVCNGCHKEISGKSTIYEDTTKEKNCWHVFCRYENIKKEIASTEQDLKWKHESIKDSKQGIIEYERKLVEQKKDMEDLAQKYPSEVVSQLL